MAATVARLENILGTADGRPNFVVYTGPSHDMDSAEWFTADNTLKVVRWNQSTGAAEIYIPGGGSNDFHVLDGGYAGVHGRGYLIIASANFVLPHCVPGESEKVNLDV